MRKTKKDFKIGEKLKEARIACGYTQEQVSEELDCSPRYIGQLETNKTSGSISIILELCNLYGVTFDYIYSDYLKCLSDSDNKIVIGYNKLNDEYKKIVNNNIAFLNDLQNQAK